MKVLAFVDLHGDEKAFDRISTKSKNVELIICAGDISNFEEKLEYFLDKLDKIGKKVLIIPGNHEFPEDLEKVFKKFKNIVNIHDKIYGFKNYNFVGHGGGGFSFKDLGFKKFHDKINNKLKKLDNIILVTHAPPYETKLDLINGNHVGSNSIKEFIIKVKPKFVICGHIHETSKVHQKLGDTRILNPGKDGKLLEI